MPVMADPPFAGAAAADPFVTAPLGGGSRHDTACLTSPFAGGSLQRRSRGDEGGKVEKLRDRREHGGVKKKKEKV